MVALDKPQITMPCTLHGAYLRLQTRTHNMQYSNTSTATMVMQMCLSVTIYGHCPFCSNFGPQDTWFLQATTLAHWFGYL